MKTIFAFMLCAELKQHPTKLMKTNRYEMLSGEYLWIHDIHINFYNKMHSYDLNMYMNSILSCVDAVHISFGIIKRRSFPFYFYQKKIQFGNKLTTEMDFSHV